MKQHEHIKIEEILALTDRSWEMLPEFAEHTADCLECQRMIERYSGIQAVLFSSRHVTRFPDPEKIVEIAERSFVLLHKEPADKSLFTKIAGFISANLKPLAVMGTAAALAVVIYTSGSETNDPDLIADNINDVKVQSDDTTETFSFKGLEKSGMRFKSRIAEVATLADTHLEAVSANEIKMRSGKAKFDVVSGNDFRITVSDKFLVRVLGTSFTLEYDSSSLIVSVSEGLVEVIRTADNSSVALSADMKQTFTVVTADILKKEQLSLVRPKIKIMQPPKLAITPDASFLTQGREALKSGNTGAAVQLFTLEMEKGQEKDKALFEAVKIHESRQKYQDAVNLIVSHNDVVRSSKVYKEEILIKGCFSQYKMKSVDLSLCREYIESFPGGYRKNEIQELINE